MALEIHNGMQLRVCARSLHFGGTRLRMRAKRIHDVMCYVAKIKNIQRDKPKAKCKAWSR